MLSSLGSVPSPIDLFNKTVGKFISSQYNIIRRCRYRD